MYNDVYTPNTDIPERRGEGRPRRRQERDRGEPSRADPQGGSPPIREADSERPGGRGAHFGRRMGGAQLHRCRIRGGGAERCERQGVGSAEVVKLIDTSVALDHLQGELKATALLSDLLARNEVVAASELTRAEVLAAIRPGERDASEQFFSVFSWVPVNEQISRVAGDLASDRPAGRHGVGAVDYLIAATAMVIGAELVTTNPRRFPMLSELKPAYT